MDGTVSRRHGEGTDTVRAQRDGTPHHDGDPGAEGRRESSRRWPRGPTRRAVREYVEEHSSAPLLETKHRPDGTTQTAACTVLRRERDEVLLYHELAAVWNVGPITIAPPMFTLA